MYGRHARPDGGSVRPRGRRTPVSPPDAAPRSRRRASGRGTPAASGTAGAPGPASHGEAVLVVDGALDTRGSERLRALLDDAVAPRRRLVLDLSAVEHVSSAALAVLVSGHRRLREGGGALVVRSPSAAVVRELRISGLHRVIEVEGVVEVEPPGRAAGQVAGTTTSSAPVSTS